MNSIEEVKTVSQPCHLCDQPTDTFVRQYETQPNLPNHHFFEKKVPLCKECFERIQPTEKNKQTLYFWSVVFPVIEEEKAP